MFLIEQAGMAGRLPQSEQGLKHLDLGFGHSVCLNAAEQRVSIVLAQLVVELALLGFHLAINGLLAFRRQFARNLLLGAAQDEGLERARQQAACLPIRITR